jgi:hypothetical protein
MQLLTGKRSQLRDEVSYFISGHTDAPQFLSADDFAHIIRYAPLVSIDLIIRDLEGKVLLGLRTNEPAKHTYFLPGGVILKMRRYGRHSREF